MMKTFVFFFLAFTVSTVSTTAPTTTTTISVSSGSYTAQQSGAFDSASTWSGGQVPTGTCSITIPAGLSVTFTGELLSVQIESLTIAGSFIISSTTAITFQYKIVITVESGGTLQDSTADNQLYFLAGSLLIVGTGGSFVGSSSEALVYTSLPSSESVTDSYSLGSEISNSFTFTILSTGVIRVFKRVMYIVVNSGAFNDSSTWLGGVVPTNDACGETTECGIYIPSYTALLTTDLNGLFNINITVITVEEAGTFSLGSLISSTGFRFQYPVYLNIYGVLNYLPLNAYGIYLPLGSAFNFYSSASFATTKTISLRSFDPSTGITSSGTVSIGASFTGPYYATIAQNGTFITSSVGK